MLNILTDLTYLQDLRWPESLRVRGEDVGEQDGAGGHHLALVVVTIAAWHNYRLIMHAGILLN